MRTLDSNSGGSVDSWSSGSSLNVVRVTHDCVTVVRSPVRSGLESAMIARWTLEID